MASAVFSSRSTMLRRYSFPGGLVNKAFGGGVVHRRQNCHELKETINFQTCLPVGRVLRADVRAALRPRDVGSLEALLALQMNLVPMQLFIMRIISSGLLVSMGMLTFSLSNRP